jgi:hypothetical protein
VDHIKTCELFQLDEKPNQIERALKMINHKENTIYDWPDDQLDWLITYGQDMIERVKYLKTQNMIIPIEGFIPKELDEQLQSEMAAQKESKLATEYVVMKLARDLQRQRQLET